MDYRAGSGGKYRYCIREEVKAGENQRRTDQCMDQFISEITTHAQPVPGGKGHDLTVYGQPQPGEGKGAQRAFEYRREGGSGNTGAGAAHLEKTVEQPGA